MIQTQKLHYSFGHYITKYNGMVGVNTVTI